ncbi:MAG: efflux RND transporter periplasmic adaptor subunit [Pseudomonadota bacterium]
MTKAVAASALLLLLGSCYETEDEGPAISTRKTVSISEVMPSGAFASRSFVGIVQSAQRVRLAFAQPGAIAVMNVDLGDHVAADVELATLELQPFDRRREQAKAGLDRAIATFEDLEQRHTAQKKLVRQGYFPKLTFETTKSQLEAARADVQSAQSEVELSERAIREARIISPISGSVAHRRTEPGEFVSPGQTVFEIDGDGALEAVVTVPSSLASNLAKGATVTLANAGVSADGVVLNIAERRRAGGLVTVEVLIIDEYSDFDPGSVVEVNFSLPSSDQNKVSLPLSAFLPSDVANEGSVFVFDPYTDLIERVNVTVTPTGREMLETQSLESGTLIVSAGVRFLSDGDHVRPLPLTSE